MYIRLITNSIMITLKIIFVTTQDYFTLTLIDTEGVYQDFSKDKEMFDFSNYSDRSKCYANVNKLVFGKNER